MDEHNRYQRQLILPGFGTTAQLQLQRARVLVVGAGGLGNPILLYLAGAGVGTLGIVDFDTVQLSNLHRQVLFTESDLRLNKAIQAAQGLAARNSSITIRPYTIQLTEQNCLEIIQEFDIIVDGTDNFATRYLLNDACVLKQKVYVYGAISGFQGQVAVFDNRSGDGVQYRDLFPEPPPPRIIQNCNSNGVLGVLPGVIGMLMATEVIKLITGIGNTLVNQLLTYDALTQQSVVYAIEPRPGSTDLIPKLDQGFRQTDYAFLCGEKNEVIMLEWSNFLTVVNNPNILVVDVRERGETPIPTQFQFISIPMSELEDRWQEMKGKTVALFCQSGKRSSAAAAQLKPKLGMETILYTLKNGLNGYGKEIG